MTEMTGTARAMVAHARTDPFGRAALVLIRLGVAVATVGLSELHREVRRNGPHLDLT